MAGLREQALGRFGIEGVGTAGRIMSREAGRNRAGGEHAATAGDVAQNRVAIDREIEGPPYPRIRERSAPGVDRDVQRPQGGAPLQLGRMRRFPPRGLAERHLDHAEPARFVFRGLGQLLRNDADPERIGSWPGAPVVGVRGEHDGVIVRPGHESPRTGADRMLSQFRAGIGRNDRGHGHREQGEKDVERFLQRHHDGRIVRDGDPGDIGRGAGGVRARALNGIERPAPSAGAARSERAQDGAPHHRGGERRSVMELHPAPQGEDISGACRINGPVPRQARNDGSFDRLLYQVVIKERHHFTGRHIGRERRIERTRVLRKRVLQGPIRGSGAAPGKRQGAESAEN